VILHPALLDRLRRPPRTRMRASEALGAVLAGSAEIDGETVTVVAEGPLADLAAKVTSLASAPVQVEPPSGLLATLRPYQRRGLAWLAGMCEAGIGGCLADDMGLGKTIQVIALHLHRREAKAGPTLVVCPASLLGTWEREVRRFSPDVPVRRYHGGGRHLEDLAADEIVLVTYGVVLRDSARLAEVGWGLVVADEAQHAKNPLSRTARELRAVPAPARIALTGTPVENRLSELWAILDWTTPGLLGHLEAFTRRVAVPVERYRDAEATGRLAALIRPFLLRRRKTDPGIAPELPRKTESDVFVPLTAEQVTLYEAMVRETMEAISRSEGIERAGLVFKLLTALKQICNHPAQYLKQPAPLEGRSGKLAAFDELTDIILAGGESMLVFTQYTQMGALLQQHLEARGIGSLFLHGGVPVPRREEMVARFQAGGVPVFLLSLKAGGTGLTLTQATHVLHYDRWWNPAVEDQAINRAHRLGQKSSVFVTRFVSPGTIEGRIAEVLERKRQLFNELIEQNGPPPSLGLTEEDVFGLFNIRSRPRRSAA
jgi:SNF2 family DNA or RNA helicase